MEKEKMIFQQQQAQPRHMIVELMPKACTTCGKVVHAFFQSQEEFDGFKCVDCNVEVKEIPNDTI
jgi:hypothetical protein